MTTMIIKNEERKARRSEREFSLSFSFYLSVIVPHTAGLLLIILGIWWEVAAVFVVVINLLLIVWSSLFWSHELTQIVRSENLLTCKLLRGYFILLTVFNLMLDKVFFCSINEVRMCEKVLWMSIKMPWNNWIATRTICLMGIKLRKKL